VLFAEVQQTCFKKQLLENHLLDELAHIEYKNVLYYNNLLNEKAIKILIASDSESLQGLFRLFLELSERS